MTEQHHGYLSITELNENLFFAKVDCQNLIAMGFTPLDGNKLAKEVEDPAIARKLRGSKLFPKTDLPLIRAAIAEKMGCAHGDSHLLGQLIKSAQDAMPQGYRVILEISNAGPRVGLAFPDNLPPAFPAPDGRAITAVLKSTIACAQADYTTHTRDSKK